MEDQDCFSSVSACTAWFQKMFWKSSCFGGGFGKKKKRLLYLPACLKVNKQSEFETVLEGNNDECMMQTDVTRMKWS